MLKGRRKNCFTHLSKDKINDLHESQLGDTDWNNTPSLNKAPETQKTPDREVLSLFQHLAFHNSCVNFSSRLFWGLVRGFLNVCKLPVVKTFYIKSFHG